MRYRPRYGAGVGSVAGRGDTRPHRQGRHHLQGEDDDIVLSNIVNTASLQVIMRCCHVMFLDTYFIYVMIENENLCYLEYSPSSINVFFVKIIYFFGDLIWTPLYCLLRWPKSSVSDPLNFGEDPLPEMVDPDPTWNRKNSNLFNWFFSVKDIILY